MSVMLASKIVRNKHGTHQTVLGDEQLIKLAGKDTDGKFLLIEQNSNPGVGIPMHVHKNEDEVFRVIEGKLKVFCAEKEFILSAGDTVFCPRNIPHSWEVIGEERAKILLMNFPSGLETMLGELADIKEPYDWNEVSVISKRYGIDFV